MANQLESEGSHSFTTTYSYDLDFVQSGFETSSSWFSLILRFLLKIALQFKISFLTAVRVSWETLKFSAFYLLYLQKKMVAGVYLLEGIKDLVVRILMWRRGFLFRPTTHGGLLVIASVAFVVGSLFRSGVAPTDFTRDRVLAAANTPETIIPVGRPRSEIIKYTVKEGESLATVAAAYNISVDTIKWANNLPSIDSVNTGDSLSIPPVTGVVHKAESGDTVASLAQKYEADQQTIVDYPFNYIDDSLALTAGQTLFVPGGKKPDPKPAYWPARNYPIYVAGGSGIFDWPVRGGISQFPSWWHPAVDIAVPYGTAIYAAYGGIVNTANYSRYGYGLHIIIDGDGYSIIYAHLSDIKVAAGQTVSKGQLIGAVGCTGRCTGPHLHFEVHRDGASINPLSLLP